VLLFAVDIDWVCARFTPGRVDRIIAEATAIPTNSALNLSMELIGLFGVSR
jgi:hypothetical protein